MAAKKPRTATAAAANPGLLSDASDKSKPASRSRRGSKTAAN